MSGPRRCQGDDGGTVVLALAFLSLFAVFVSALLWGGEVHLRASRTFEEGKQASYAVDGAVEGAIHNLRSQAGMGNEGGACPTFTSPASANGAADVTVTCEGLDGSGAGSTGANPNNRPPHALLTLAGGGETGVVQASNSLLRVKGDVASNGAVNVPASDAAMAVEGGLTARSCNGTITTTGDKQCASTTTFTDPAYAMDPRASLTARSAPACGTAANKVVTFTPGRYSSAAGLNALTDSASCTGRLLWFQPGVYYFDFLDAGSHEWVVDDRDADVVGGTPLGWSPTAATRPSVPVPDGCDATEDGVQFVFGGDSRVNVVSGGFQLCAQPSETTQNIAVYGVRADVPSSQATATPTPALGSSTGFSSAEAGKARVIDAVSGSVSLATGATTSASVTMNGFDFAAIPAGSTLDAVTLRIAHAEAGNVASVSATVTPAGGTASTVNSNEKNCTLCLRSSLTEDKIDLKAMGVDTVAELGSGLSVAFETRLEGGRSKAGSETLDGLMIEVRYTPPGWRAQSGCVTAAPYVQGSATSCAVLKVGGAQERFHVNGTIYVPRAAIDVKLTNIAYAVAKRGIVARSAMLAVTPSALFTGSPIAVPDFSVAAAPRLVRLVASVGGVPWLRAVVQFVDSPSTGAVANVQSWSVLR